MKQFKEPNTSLKREESPIITQSNIKPNMFLKYSRTHTLNMSHKREFRKELSMIGIWNTFHKKEFRKESNIRQLRDKLYTNLNKKSNKSNTYNHLYNTSNNHLYNTSNNHLFNTSNHQ